MVQQQSWRQNSGCKVGSTLSDSKPVNCGVPQGLSWARPFSSCTPIVFQTQSRTFPQIPPLFSMLTTPKLLITWASQSCKTRWGKRGRIYIPCTRQCCTRIGLKLNSSKTQCMLCGPVWSLAQIRGDSDPMLHVQGESLKWTALWMTLAFRLMTGWRLQITLTA